MPGSVPPSKQDWDVGPVPYKSVPWEFAVLEGRYGDGGNKGGNKGVEREVPRELRETVKRARGMKGMVRVLEERVRGFVEGHLGVQDIVLPVGQEKPKTTTEEKEEGGNGSRPTTSAGGEWVMVDTPLPTPLPTQETDGEEEEKEDIVFIPKNLSMTGSIPSLPPINLPIAPGKPQHITIGEQKPKEIPVFHSPPTDPSARLVRYMVHALAEYYGLRSWSVTHVGGDVPKEMEGQGEVRVAYVGLNQTKKKRRGGDKGMERGLPRPLWVLL